jgi:hypothetical protein
VDVDTADQISPGVGGRKAAYDAGLRLAAEALSRGAAELLRDVDELTGQIGS